jgi:hypothetical protein
MSEADEECSLASIIACSCKLSRLSRLSIIRNRLPRYEASDFPTAPTGRSAWAADFRLGY